MHSDRLGRSSVDVAAVAGPGHTGLVAGIAGRAASRDNCPVVAVADSRIDPASGLGKALLVHAGSRLAVEGRSSLDHHMPMLEAASRSHWTDMAKVLAAVGIDLAAGLAAGRTEGQAVDSRSRAVAADIGCSSS